VTAVASEAGKKAYTAFHNWILKLFNELSERKIPSSILFPIKMDVRYFSYFVVKT
jgi:hypothetical protein